MKQRSNPCFAICVALFATLVMSGCASPEKRPLDPDVLKQRAIDGVKDWPSGEQVIAKVEATEVFKKEDEDGSKEESQALESGDAAPELSDEEKPTPVEGWWYLRFKIPWEGAKNEEKKAEEELPPNVDAVVGREVYCACKEEAKGDAVETEADKKDKPVSEQSVDQNKVVAKEEGKEERVAKAEADSAKKNDEEKKKEPEGKQVKKDTNKDDIADPSWYVGSLIADRVLAPVIREQGKDIFLWRFHRRAGRDTKGHQFSLIFFSNAETAEQISESIKADATVAALIEEGVLEEVIYPDITEYKYPRVADTSDARWPEEIQNAWPVFIQGASEMWLMLLETISHRHPDYNEEMSAEALVDLYKDVEDEMDTLWREEARHAYFHHLNAIFGYEYLLMRF